MSLTPEQFNKLVTKDYLDEKLENYATKDDMRKINEKLGDIEKQIDTIVIETLATKEKLEDFATKEDLTSMKNEILTAIDGLAKGQVKFEHEATSNVGAHDRMGEKLDNHETRIKKLELASAI